MKTWLIIFGFDPEDQAKILRFQKDPKSTKGSPLINLHNLNHGQEVVDLNEKSEGLGQYVFFRGKGIDYGQISISAEKDNKAFYLIITDGIGNTTHYSAIRQKDSNVYLGNDGQEKDNFVAIFLPIEW